VVGGIFDVKWFKKIFFLIRYGQTVRLQSQIHPLRARHADPVSGLLIFKTHLAAINAVIIHTRSLGFGELLIF
jgi:hypothetical protein